MSYWIKYEIKTMCAFTGRVYLNAEESMSFESVLPCFKTILKALRKNS